jgi:hypothetical protein
MQYHHNDLRNRDNRRIQSINDFIALLSQRGCRPRRSANGWVALCPAHELDGRKHNPSLSVGVGQDGRILVKCFANCSTERVLAAMGLQMSDLMPPQHSVVLTSNRIVGASARRDSENSEPRDGKAFASAEDAITVLARQLKCEPTHKWPYCNVRGELIAYAVRFDPPGRGKVIRYISLREVGWQIRGIPEPRPPYRLPDILSIKERDCLVIIEGEKTADAAVRCGLVATTSAGGAEAASKTNWALLEPATWRRIVILPDNDEPGKKYADDVARLLWAAGARDVRILRLADYAKQLPEGGDLADVIESPNLCGLPLAEGAALTEVGEWVLQTAEQTERWEPEITAGYLQWEPYPVDALPSPFSEFVRETARAIGCDESFVALPLLAEAAAAIGTTRVLELKSTWRVPPVLWAVIVGKSGSLKTAALRATLEWAEEREKALQFEYEREWQKYQDDLADWKENSGLADKKPREPLAKRLIVKDVTIEALAPILKRNPRGVFLVQDELAAWLRGFDKYTKNAKGAEAAKWNELYYARSLTIDRKTSGTIYVPLAAVCVVGGIQPHILKRALTVELRECGMAARLLMTMPPWRKKRWARNVVDVPSSDAVKRVLDKLFELKHEHKLDGDVKPIVMRLSADADAEFAAFYDAHAESLENANGDLESALSRLEELPARLAVVIHLARWANGEQVNPDIVDADSMQRAIRLTRWHIHETQRIYQFLDASGGEESQLELLAWLQRRGGRATVRELYTAGPREFRGKLEAAETALNEMAKAGLGFWDNAANPQGGRPTRIFRLANNWQRNQNPKNPIENRGFRCQTRDGDSDGDGGADENPGGDSVPPSDRDSPSGYSEGGICADENPRPESAWNQNPRNPKEFEGFDSAASYDIGPRGADENRADEIPADENQGADENRADEIPADENQGADENRADEIQLGEDERQLLAWLRQHGGTATVREIRRGLRAMQRPGVAEAILERFFQLGLGQWEPAPAGRRGRVARRFRLLQPTDAPSGQPAAEPENREAEPLPTLPGSRSTAEPATQTEPATATPAATPTEVAEPVAEAEPALEPAPELAPLEILDRAMRLPTEWRDRFWQLLDAAGRCPLPDRATRAYRQLLAELPRELKADTGCRSESGTEPARQRSHRRHDGKAVARIAAAVLADLRPLCWEIRVKSCPGSRGRNCNAKSPRTLTRTHRKMGVSDARTRVNGRGHCRRNPALRPGDGSQTYSRRYLAGTGRFTPNRDRCRVGQTGRGAGSTDCRAR